LVAEHMSVKDYPLPASLERYREMPGSNDHRPGEKASEPATASPARPSRGDEAVATASGTAVTQPPDPVERSIELLGKTKRKMIRLIRFLVANEGRQATLETIVREFYKLNSVNDRRLRTARRFTERTRSALEGESCPLRLDIDRGTVRLFDATTGASN
jgi:hypothetical protein